MTFYAELLSLLAPGPRSGVELFQICPLSSSSIEVIGGRLDLVTTQSMMACRKRERAGEPALSGTSRGAKKEDGDIG